MWPFVAGMIEKSLPKSPRLYEPADILGYLKEASAQLWIAARGKEIIGCWITCRVQYPRTMSLKLWIIGGRELKLWAELMRERMTEHATLKGCEFLEGGGRRGWTRLFGRRYVWHDLGAVLLMEI